MVPLRCRARKGGQVDLFTALRLRHFLFGSLQSLVFGALSGAGAELSLSIDPAAPALLSDGPVDSGRTGGPTGLSPHFGGADLTAAGSLAQPEFACPKRTGR